MRITKHFILALAAMMVTANAWAVRAKSVQTVHTQSDGKTITVVLAGDEHRHGYITTDGYAVIKAADGNFYYLNQGETSRVLAHNVQDRDNAEQQFIAQNAHNLVIATSESQARRAPRKVALKDVDSQVPTSGSPHIPIILVSYKDLKLKGDNPIESMVEHYVTGDKSAFNYFKDQSYGKFTPQFDILGVVELSGNRSEYGGNTNNSPYGDDIGVGKMVAEACLSVPDFVDWSLYDNNGDGDCDVVIVLYAGPSEAQGADMNAVWPMQWELEYSDYGQTIEIDSIKINKFAVFNELVGTDDDGTVLDGIGTFCHEFSHCIGLPDFYATNNMGYYGMGRWSIMDYGNYNDESNTPVGYTAYERNYLGWMDIEEAQPNSIITLAPVPAGGKAYKITNDQVASGNEYFIIEAREQTGWETFMAGSGLMITHVDYDPIVWEYNSVNNNGQRQRMTIVPADNKSSLYNEEGDLYPNAAGNNELTDSSTPAARVYTGEGSVKRLHKPITDITRNDDGTITLKFMYTGVKGDVNGDDSVDIADVNILINIILGIDDAANYEGRALVNDDDVVDIADVNLLINTILGI